MRSGRPGKAASFGWTLFVKDFDSPTRSGCSSIFKALFMPHASPRRMKKPNQANQGNLRPLFSEQMDMPHAAPRPMKMRRRSADGRRQTADCGRRSAVGGQRSAFSEQISMPREAPRRTKTGRDLGIGGAHPFHPLIP